MTNKENLRIGNAKKLLLTIWKDIWNFGNSMRKKDLEKLTLTRHMKGKRSRGKQLVIYLTTLKKWIEK